MLSIAAIVLGGCYQSPARTQYLGHLGASVEAGPAKDDRLARAFGLDARDETTLARSNERAD